MSNETPRNVAVPVGPVDRARDAVAWAGVALFAALAGIVPLTCVPPSVIEFDTLAKEITYIKKVAIHGVGAAIIVLGALMCLFARREYFSTAALQRLAVLLVASSILLATAFSPSPAFSLWWGSTEMLLLVCVLLAPMFLTSLARVRTVLIAGVVSGAGVALLGLLRAMDITVFYDFIYGMDPVSAILEGRQEELGRVEGGVFRASMISTLGNPEYTGTFLAGAFLVGFAMWMDGLGARRLRSLPMWLLVTVAIAVIGAGILLAQTRVAFLAIGAGVLFRWLAVVRVPGIVGAASLAVLIACLFVGGVPLAMLVVLLGLGMMVGWQWRTRALRTMIMAWPWRVRAMLGAVPVAIVLVLLVAPFNDGIGLRVRALTERFTSATTMSDPSSRSRLLFYMMAGEIVRHNPVFGAGPGLFPSRYHSALAAMIDEDDTGVMEAVQVRMGSWIARETHSDYFQIAAERGAFGLAAFLALIAAVFIGLARHVREGDDAQRAVALAIGMGLVGYLGVMITSFPLQEGARLAFFYALISCGVAMAAIEPVPRDQSSVALSARASQGSAESSG